MENDTAPTTMAKNDLRRNSAAATKGTPRPVTKRKAPGGTLMPKEYRAQLATLLEKAEAVQRLFDANEPHTSAWRQLCRVLERAKADTTIAKSDDVLAFVDFVHALSSRAIGVDDPIDPLKFVLEKDRMENLRAKLSDQRKRKREEQEEQAPKLFKDYVDKYGKARGFNTHLAHHLGITEGAASKLRARLKLS